jgi:pimeloyl-ACP methyl ester carboxylesterase
MSIKLLAPLRQFDDRSFAARRADGDGDESPLDGTPSRELVFLLHGFAGRPVLMSRLARHLLRRDYAVCNWTYHSVRKGVAYSADRLREAIALASAEGSYSRIHFVTHSLGSIVVRQMLCQFPLTGIGRIVMLGPPNAGSHFARFGSVFLRRLCPVLPEISDRKTSFVNNLGEPHDVEIGVIAGTGDWVVWQKNTHLQTERDHIVLRAGHLRLPFVRTCVEQTEHFLKHGTFNHSHARDLNRR